MFPHLPVRDVLIDLEMGVESVCLAASNVKEAETIFSQGSDNAATLWNNWFDIKTASILPGL